MPAIRENKKQLWYKYIPFQITAILLAIIISIFYNIKYTNSAEFSANQLYKITKKKLKKADYTGAIQNLIQLQNLHLFDPYPQQICLNLIYAYYKISNWESANNLIKQFITLYPNHKYLDYVLYIHGIIHMHLDQPNAKILIKLFNLTRKEYNPMYAYIAFHDFSELIQKYPNSLYARDAHKRLIFLKNRMAEYELYIVKFYHKKNAYISVITRSEKILYYFPDTQSAYKTLYYLQIAYSKIGLFEQSDKVKKIIAANTTY